MTLKVRRIISLIFILLFLTIAPAIVLYAAGFKFNKNNFIVTPAKIKNLLPGEYNLSLELNGYSGWQKKLTIYPGSSTFAEDIYLFKNDLPVQIFPAKIKY